VGVEVSRGILRIGTPLVVTGATFLPSLPPSFPPFFPFGVCNEPCPPSLLRLPLLLSLLPSLSSLPPSLPSSSRRASGARCRDLYSEQSQGAPAGREGHPSCHQGTPPLSSSLPPSLPPSHEIVISFRSSLLPSLFPSLTGRSSARRIPTLCLAGTSPPSTHVSWRKRKGGKGKGEENVNDGNSLVWFLFSCDCFDSTPFPSQRHLAAGPHHSHSPPFPPPSLPPSLSPCS